MKASLKCEPNKCQFESNKHESARKLSSEEFKCDVNHKNLNLNQTSVNINMNPVNFNLNLNQMKQCESKCESNKSILTQIDSLKAGVQMCHMMIKVRRIAILLVIGLGLRINTTHFSSFFFLFFCQRANLRIL